MTTPQRSRKRGKPELSDPYNTTFYRTDITVYSSYEPDANNLADLMLEAESGCSGRSAQGYFGAVLDQVSVQKYRGNELPDKPCAFFEQYEEPNPRHYA